MSMNCFQPKNSDENDSNREFSKVLQVRRTAPRPGVGKNDAILRMTSGGIRSNMHLAFSSIERLTSMDRLICDVTSGDSDCARVAQSERVARDERVARIR